MQNFINKHYQLCSFRGIDPLNPIDFVIQPIEGVEQTWVLLCSVTEPTFSRVPYNVLWMPLSADDPNFKKILRRVSHETTTPPYRSQWEELTEVTDMWSEPQYWIPVVTDLSLLGLESPNDGIGPATTSNPIGIAYLTPNPDEDPVLPIGITTNDLRMNNPRYPRLHSHLDYARSKIKINASQYAVVDKSFPPEDGMLLFLEAINPENANEFLAVWRYPRQVDVGFVDRSLLSIEILGLSTVAEQSQTTYQVRANFADNTSAFITPATFTNVLNASAANININGVLSTANISVSTPIRLQATYTKNGITRTATKDVNIVAGLEVTALEILGADTVEENKTSNAYSFRATFSDLSVSLVTPLTFYTEDTALVTVNANRTISVGEVESDTPTTLVASYTFGGATVQGYKTVTVTEAPVVPTTLDILGPNPASIMEGESFVFKFRVTYSDGNTVDRDVVNTFVSNNNTVFPVNQNGGVATGVAGNVTNNTSVRLDATYVEAGITLTDSFNLTVTDVAQPQAAEIFNGLTDFYEDQPQVYRARIRFDNNTVIGVNDSARTVWSIVTGGSFAQLVEHPTDGSAVLTPNDISANQTVRIRVVATYNGVDYTAEQDLTVRARIITPTAVKIVPVGTPPAQWNSFPTSAEIEAGHQSFNYMLLIRTSANPTTWIEFDSSPYAAQGSVNYSVASPNYGITRTVFAAPAQTDLFYSVPLALDQNRDVQLIIALTLNGVQVNGSHTINAKALSTDISARWGQAPQQEFMSDYANAAFYDLLTNNLTGVDDEQFTTPPSTDYNSISYLMFPKEWGYIYILNTNNGFYGSWDGGGSVQQEGAFMAAVEVTIAGKQYYVYRMSFPAFPTAVTWRIRYGASSEWSNEP